MPASRDSVELAIIAAEAAADVKAADLLLLEVADVLALVDVFLLATGGSDRQIRAVADRIEERLRDLDRRPLRREGTPASGWYVLDYGDLVCHVFGQEQRETYSLERIWGDVPRLDPESGQRRAAAVGSVAGGDLFDRQVAAVSQRAPAAEESGQE